MKVIATALLMLSCVSGLAIAQQTPAAPAADRPTDDSVRQLLQIQKAQTVIEKVSKQMDATFTAMINQQLQNKELSAEDQQRVEAGRARLKEITGKLLNWQTMEPMYVKIYEDSFSQSEIDSMIAFYSSPPGQAIVAKLPLVAQNTLIAMQEQMKPLMPQAQQIAKDTATAINTKHGKSDKPSPG